MPSPSVAATSRSGRGPLCARTSQRPVFSVKTRSGRPSPVTSSRHQTHRYVRRRAVSNVVIPAGIEVAESRALVGATRQVHAPCGVVETADQVVPAVAVEICCADQTPDAGRKTCRLRWRECVAQTAACLPPQDAVPVRQVRKAIAIQVERYRVEGWWRREERLEVRPGGQEPLVVPGRATEGQLAAQDQQVLPAIAVEIGCSPGAIEQRQHGISTIDARAERWWSVRGRSPTRYCAGSVRHSSGCRRDRRVRRRPRRWRAARDRRGGKPGVHRGQKTTGPVGPVHKPGGW